MCESAVLDTWPHMELIRFQWIFIDFHKCSLIFLHFHYISILRRGSSCLFDVMCLQVAKNGVRSRWIGTPSLWHNGLHIIPRIPGRFAMEGNRGIAFKSGFRTQRVWHKFSSDGLKMSNFSFSDLGGFVLQKGSRGIGVAKHVIWRSPTRMATCFSPKDVFRGGPYKNKW